MSTAAPFPATAAPGAASPSRNALTAGLTPQEHFLVKKVQDTGVTESQLITARKYHRDENGRASAFSMVLVEFGFCTEGELAQWIGEHNKLPVLTAQELMPTPDALRYLSQTVARTRCAIPVSKVDGVLTVAIADPEWPQFTQVRHALSQTKYKFVVAPASDILTAIDAAYMERVALSAGENELEQFVEGLFRDAATGTGSASDIHVIPDDRLVVVKYRVDGVLQQRHAVDGTLRDQLAAALKLSSKRDADGRTRLSGVGGLDTTQRNRPQGASARRDYGSRRFSLRYSVVPTIYGERIVVRLLDQNAQVGDLATLGMLDDHAAIYRKCVRLPYGLILNCGPTGHGKSTTLAAAVKYIDVHRKAVLTIEDPVEYRLRGVSQCQVLPEMGFAEALREFLRQNPDIILLGEIRDVETGQIGISISQTGHLLLTTVHANSAVGGIVRLIELGIDPSKIAFSAKLLLSQRLVRRLCQSCRRVHSKAAEWEERYGRLIEMGMKAGFLPDGVHFHEAGGGCPQCNNTGFKRRIAIFELRPVRPEVQAMLSRAAQGDRFNGILAEEIYTRDFEAGLIAARTMEQDGMLKAAAGLVSPEEILAATVADMQ